MGKLDNKIIITLDGGLGNQLFQWAHGYHLGLINKKEILFNKSSNVINQNKNDVRPILLNELGIQTKYTKVPFQNQRLFSIFNSISCRYHFINEIAMEYFPNSIKEYQCRTIITKGFWQSHSYFNMIAKELKSTIQIQGKINEKTIGMHIRRGDYVNNKNNARIYVNLFKTDYYQKAIDTMKKKYPNYTIKIFSDNIAWCKKNFSQDFLFSTNTNIIDDFKELSLCEHQIIANSTFSWWAAYLNKNKNKSVVIPEKWYLNDWSNEGLLLSNWIKL